MSSRTATSLPRTVESSAMMSSTHRTHTVLAHRRSSEVGEHVEQLRWCRQPTKGRHAVQQACLAPHVHAANEQPMPGDWVVIDHAHVGPRPGSRCPAGGRMRTQLGPPFMRVAFRKHNRVQACQRMARLHVPLRPVQVADQLEFAASASHQVPASAQFQPVPMSVVTSVSSARSIAKRRSTVAK